MTHSEEKILMYLRNWKKQQMASTIYEECKECKKSNLEKLYYNRLLKLLDMVEDEED